MYYQFLRVPSRKDKRPSEPFSGWCSTWGGIVKETSHAMAGFGGEPISKVIEWAKRNDVTWHVSEKRT